MKDYVEVNDVKVIQKLLFVLLDEFHKICEENNLIYNIEYGTLIGAVRHKDIIPWDDDIDVSMPRPDYEKFIEIVKNKKSDRFYLYAYPDKNYIYPYAKLGLKKTVWIEDAVKDDFAKLMLYLDIFPMDGLPCDKLEQEKHINEISRLKLKKIHCAYKALSSTKIKTVIKKVLYAFDTFPHCVNNDYMHYLRKEIELQSKYDFENSEYVTHLFDFAKKGIIKKQDYLNRKLYQLGENQYWGVADADSRLRAFYGDYMTPPPEEKRISHHGYRLYVDKELLK